MSEKIFLNLILKSSEDEKKRIYLNMLDNLSVCDVTLINNDIIFYDMVSDEDLLNKLKKKALSSLSAPSKHLMAKIFWKLVENNCYENITEQDMKIIESNYINSPYIDNKIYECNQTNYIMLNLLHFDSVIVIKKNDLDFWFNIVDMILLIINDIDNNSHDYKNNNLHNYKNRHKLNKTYYEKCLTKAIYVINQTKDYLAIMTKSKNINSLLFFKILFLEILKDKNDGMYHLICLIKKKQYLNLLFDDKDIRNNKNFYCHINIWFNKIDNNSNIILIECNCIDIVNNGYLDEKSIDNLISLFNGYNYHNNIFMLNKIAFILKYQQSIIKKYNILKKMIHETIKIMNIDDLSKLNDEFVCKFLVLENLNTNNDEHKKFFFQMINDKDKYITQKILSLINVEYIINDNKEFYVKPFIKFLYLIYNNIQQISDNIIVEIMKSCEDNILIKFFNDSINKVNHVNLNEHIPNKNSMVRILNLNLNLFNKIIDKRIDIINKNTDNTIAKLNKKRLVSETNLNCENILNDLLNYRIDEKYLCKICCENTISKIFECNHLICEKCSERILNKCPFCRKISVCKNMFI